jgi:hypothetical protein
MRGRASTAQYIYTPRASLEYIVVRCGLPTKPSSNFCSGSENNRAQPPVMGTAVFNRRLLIKRRMAGRDRFPTVNVKNGRQSATTGTC